MTFYSVHNAAAFGWEDQLFAFAEPDSMDPPVTLIWGSSFEDAYETYIQEAAWSHTFEEAKEIWDHLDFESDDWPDYFSMNADGDLVHTEAIQGYEVDRDAPTYLLAVVLSVHEAAERELYAVVSNAGNDLDAQRILRRAESAGYEATLTDWNHGPGREKDIESITGGRLNTDSKYIVWGVRDEESDPYGEDCFYRASGGRALREVVVHPLDFVEYGFQVPPSIGSALFFFPGTEEELEALNVPGVDPYFDPLVDTRPGAGEYPRSGRYVWTRDPTIKLGMDAFGRQAGIVREVTMALDALEGFLVVEDMLMQAGVDGFIAMWPPKDGRVWEGHSWKLLRGQKELDRAKEGLWSPDIEKVRYVLQNPAKRQRKLKNRLLR